MYTIKEKPGDFIVKEIPDYTLDETGNYSYFWLIKKNCTTVNAVIRIADKLNIISKRIGFAGSKDKVAITKQVISIRDIKKEQVEKIKLIGIRLDYIGQGTTPISLGDLKGNEFVITVKDLNTKEIKKIQGISQIGVSKIPNLFGPQRFSKNNAEVGKALIKKNFKKATDLIDNQEVELYIEQNPVDFIGALRQIALKTRKIYIHAYQSLIWNKTVEQFLKPSNESEKGLEKSGISQRTAPYKNIKIPIVGFGTDIENIDTNIKEIILDILNKEELTERDFILKEIKELSSEGDERDLFITPENFHIQLKENTAIITFSLPKGSYATTVIEFIFL